MTRLRNFGSVEKYFLVLSISSILGANFDSSVDTPRFPNLDSPPGITFSKRNGIRINLEAERDGGEHSARRRL